MNRWKVSLSMVPKGPCTMLQRRVFLNKTKKTRWAKKMKANVVRMKRDLAAIRKQQQDIKRGHKEIKDKFEEIECGCNQLKLDTEIIASQNARNQTRLNTMFAILKARQENNLELAHNLARSLASMQ